MKFYKFLLAGGLLSAILFSCSVSKTYPFQYYALHQKTLDSLQDVYKKITATKSIAIAFTDWNFNSITLELKSDSIRYIYDFKYGEPRIKDTLEKYGYPYQSVQFIVESMQRVRCTWINTLDYYVDNQSGTLLFMGVNAKRFAFNLKSKYYLFNFYAQPQYYDADGKLLDKKKLTRLRKINNETFYRINDKVCYTVSSKFR